MFHRRPSIGRIGWKAPEQIGSGFWWQSDNSHVGYLRGSSEQSVSKN
jgi:hypothetical protein